jgi:hypothetical protein
LFAGLWLFYTWVRSAAESSEADAFANAERIADLQNQLSIGFESQLQAAIAWAPLFVAANSYYLVHFPVTVFVLVFAYRYARDTSFVHLRSSLIIATAVGLFVHLAFPMAPPRMLSGFIDTGLVHGPDPYSVPGSHNANQFAAMPSMHVAWALLVGNAMWQTTRNWTVRLVAQAHLMITTFVVIVTAHHFILDAVAGIAIASIASAIVYWRATGDDPAANAASAQHLIDAH